MISVYKWRSIVETAACGHGKLHAGTLRKLCLTTQRNSWIRECKAVLHFSHSKLRNNAASVPLHPLYAVSRASTAFGRIIHRMTQYACHLRVN